MTMDKETERDQGGRRTTTPNAGPGTAAAGVPACDDLGLAIARDGTWLYRGSPIRRPALVRLFATVLRRHEDGSYWMETPVERGRIAVEDVPFTVVELRASGGATDQRIDLRTNLDAWVELGPDHPLGLRPFDGALVPYVPVRAGLEARLERAVYYHLVDLGAEEGEAGRFGVWSRGVFFPLEAGS